MIARMFAAALLAGTLAGSANAGEFVYSATSGPTCRTIRAKSEFNSWRCRGPSGYRAVFHDLGNLVAVEFGPSGKERALVEESMMWPGATKPFGDRVELRLNEGSPYAAILRTWRQDFDSNSGAPTTSDELLVIKVSPQGACRIGTVDGKQADANAIARQIADSSAETFRCGRHQPHVAAATSVVPRR